MSEDTSDRLGLSSDICRMLTCDDKAHLVLTPFSSCLLSHSISLLPSHLSSGIRLVIGGISHGEALSLYLTMRKALGTFLDGSDASFMPMDATVALSTWLPVSAEGPISIDPQERCQGVLSRLFCSYFLF